MNLLFNLKSLSDRKNKDWGEHATKLIECYQKNKSEEINEPMKALNKIFEKNGLSPIPESLFFTEYRAWIKSILGIH